PPGRVPRAGPRGAAVTARRGGAGRRPGRGRDAARRSAAGLARRGAQPTRHSQRRAVARPAARRGGGRGSLGAGPRGPPARRRAAVLVRLGALARRRDGRGPRREGYRLAVGWNWSRWSGGGGSGGGWSGVRTPASCRG